MSGDKRQDGTTGAEVPGFFRGTGPWIALGLVFLCLNLLNGDGPGSPLWFAEPALYALMIAGLWRRRDPTVPPRRRRTAPLAYIALSWLFGMIYELSLTVDGTGIGGVHPDTRASFVLAQGDYILIAVVSWLAIRQLRLDFRQAFFFAGGIGLTEGLIFTGILTQVIASPAFWMAPLFLAYYTLVYAAFVAMPLLFVDPRSLWRPGTPARPTPVVLLWLLGFGLAFAIRVVWGLGYAPLVEWAFGLPPNPLP